MLTNYFHTCSLLTSLFLSSKSEDEKSLCLSLMASKLSLLSKSLSPLSMLLAVKAVVESPFPADGITGASQRIKVISNLSPAILHLLDPDLIIQLVSQLAALYAGSRSISAQTAVSFEATYGVPEFLSLLGSGLLQHLNSLNHNQLVSLSSSIARLGWRPGLLIQGISQRLAGHLHRLDSEKSLELLWSLATMKVKKSITNSIASSCLSRAINGGGYTPDQLSTLVWCCGRLRFRDDVLLKPVLQLLIRSDTKLRPR